MVYCEAKSAVAAVRVTSTVPEPVRVPEPEITTAAAGTRLALALTVMLPSALMLVFTDTSALVLESVKLLKAVVELPPMA